MWHTSWLRQSTMDCSCSCDGLSSFSRCDSCCGLVFKVLVSSEIYKIFLSVFIFRLLHISKEIILLLSRNELSLSFLITLCAWNILTLSDAIPMGAMCFLLFKRATPSLCDLCSLCGFWTQYIALLLLSLPSGLFSFSFHWLWTLRQPNDKFGGNVHPIKGTDLLVVFAFTDNALCVPKNWKFTQTE